MEFKDRMGNVDAVAVDTDTTVDNIGVSEDESSANPNNDPSNSNPGSDNKPIRHSVNRGTDTDSSSRDEDSSDNNDDGNIPALQERLAELSRNDDSNSEDEPQSAGVCRESQIST